MVRWRTTTALSALFLTLSAPAWADDAAAIGDKGEFIVSADRLMGLVDFTSTKYSENMGGTKSSASHNFSAIALLQNPSAISAGDISGLPAAPTIAPYNFPRFSFDYTVIPHLTIGGSAVFYINPGANDTTTGKAMGGASTSSTVGSPTQTMVGFEPRAGYVLGINKYLAVWPRAGVSVYYIHESIPTGTSSTSLSANATTLMLNLEPMLLITPAQHVAITAGPTCDFSFFGSANTTSTMDSTSTETKYNMFLFHFGVELGLVAWF